MSKLDIRVRVGNLAGRESAELDAVLDTSRFHTVLPASILDKVGVKRVDRRLFSASDGQQIEFDIGHAIVGIEDREAPMKVLFSEDGTEAIVGRFALSGMLLKLDPTGERLTDIGPIPFHEHPVSMEPLDSSLRSE